MPVYIAVIIGVVIGVALLAISMVTWWVIQAVHEFRRAIEALQATMDKVSATIIPLLSDPKLDDYGKALQAMATAVPVASVQLKSLTELVGNFYGMAMTNAAVAPPPTPKPLPSADANDSQIFHYSEQLASALEQKAEAAARGIIMEEPVVAPAGITAEV